MADLIHIADLELSTHIGVPEEERAAPQRLTVSLTLEPRRDFRDLGDALENTVNYFTLTRDVQALARARMRRLIETLAQEIAELVLAKYPVRSVDVELRKYILPDTAHVAIRLRRGKPMSTRLVQSPLNPEWLIPEGWERILGLHMDYWLGDSVLHLWQVQFNQHVPAAHAGPTHLHARHQLLYYQRGQGLLEVDGAEYAIELGSIFLVPAGRAHRFSGRGEEAPVCLAMDFSIDEARTPPPDEAPSESEAAILLSLLYAQPARPFPLQAVDQLAINRCIDDIVRENEAREVGYTVLIQAHLLRLIAHCLRGAQRAQGFGEHFRHTAWRHRLIAERAMALARSHASRQPELALEDAARHCATSANHLNRILREQAGLTFRQLLIRQRLEIAHDLLLGGRLNCTEAALEAGFDDPNYFSRAFRRVYGHAPSDLLARSGKAAGR